MALDTAPLVHALRKYEENGGVWAELERATARLGKKVSAATIGRTASGITTASPSTWEALCEARPDVIPPPPWRKSAPVGRVKAKARDAGLRPKAATVGSPVIEVRIFEVGPPLSSQSTDSTLQTDSAPEYIAIPKQATDADAFVVRVQGESMSPYLNEGDVVVVAPNAPLVNGCLCLASWPGDDGRKMIKRYYRYGEKIVLRADNPAYEENVLDSNEDAAVSLYRIKQSIRQE